MDNEGGLGKIIKQRRIMIPMTLRKLSAVSGVSQSHLGRIERGERFPSASILKKIARPLSFNEGELLTSAGYLSPQSIEGETYTGSLDPYVARLLASEPVGVQRTMIGILGILESIAKVREPEAYVQKKLV